jgi:hypothetical protein
MRSLVVLALGLAGSLAAQSPRRGALAAGDATLRTGEYFDTHSFEGRAGQRVVLDLASSQFDPYLILVAPSGDRRENDDYQGSNRRARLEVELEETGTYRVLVTSYRKDEAGAYELLVAFGAGTGVARRESGRLERGDVTLESGEFSDEYAFEGQAGQHVTIDLRSRAFDPYLIVLDPSEKHTENDDHEGDGRRSLVSFALSQSGRYRVIVTSYKAGESGEYDLRIDVGDAATAVAPASRLERGVLAAGDDTLSSGEFLDVYTFDGRPGRRVTLDAVSQDFDTYLILIPPRGERRENDDVEGRPRRSVIEADLTEPGTYKVIVTSYQRGERGAYELRIDFAAAAPAGSRTRDINVIAYGDSTVGRLGNDDGLLETGEFRDIYAFEGATGDSVIIEMASREFDTYLVLLPPQGEQIDNDDAPGNPDVSRIALRLRATGRYRVLATSYAPATTGGYRLSLRGGALQRGPGGPPVAPGVRVAGRRVRGVFVGISTYPNSQDNLPYTADDARRTREALMRGAGMHADDAVLLVDGEATIDNVRQAIQRVGQQAGPQDLFVFFYSGHGGRVPRASFQREDPDNKDETLVVYDGQVTDDQFNEWLGPLRAQTSLIVLDACFSGGFSKDVISAPGRMGLFSSEEDVTSGVAAKFRAGGYLAQFLADAIGDRLADADGDRQISALELSQYLHERYRADVKSGAGSDDYVRTGGPQSGYQHLVVDRGSVGPFDVLFR